MAGEFVSCYIHFFLYRFFGGLGVTFHPMQFDLDLNHLEQVFGCLNEIIIAFCELGYTRKGAVEYISDCPIVVTI
jgi:hypothetical protein